MGCIYIPLLVPTHYNKVIFVLSLKFTIFSHKQLTFIGIVESMRSFLAGIILWLYFHMAVVFPHIFCASNPHKKKKSKHGVSKFVNCFVIPHARAASCMHDEWPAPAALPSLSFKSLSAINTYHISFNSRYISPLRNPLINCTLRPNIPPFLIIPCFPLCNQHLPLSFKLYFTPSLLFSLPLLMQFPSSFVLYLSKFPPVSYFAVFSYY